MLNPYQIEKEIYIQLDKLQTTIKQILNAIAKYAIHHSQHKTKNISPQLLSVCKKYLQDNQQSQQYHQCKICLKRFKDGRQLGGHVSRAHKEKHVQNESRHESSEHNFSEKSWQSNKKKKKPKTKIIKNTQKIKKQIQFGQDQDEINNEDKQQNLSSISIYSYQKIKRKPIKKLKKQESDQDNNNGQKLFYKNSQTQQRQFNQDCEKNKLKLINQNIDYSNFKIKQKQKQKKFIQMLIQKNQEPKVKIDNKSENKPDIFYQD